MIYRTDYHTHTKYSDGHGLPEEYIPFAIKENISELGFSDHLTLTDKQQDWSIRPDRLHQYTEEVIRLAAKQSGLSIKLGLEVDYLPGKEEEINKIICSYPFDFIIGSVHYMGEKAIDQRPEFYKEKNLENLYNDYFSLVARAAASGLFDIMGHLDLVRIFGFFPESDIKHLYRDLAQAIKKHNVSIELNTNGMNKPLRNFYPNPEYIHIFKEEDVSICVNSDSHFPSDIGQHFDEAYATILRSGYKEMVTFNKRKRELRSFV